MMMFRNVVVRTFCKTSLFKNQSRLARISTKTMPKMPQLLQPHRSKYIQLALRRFSTSERRPVNPILMFLFKIKGIKALKGVSIIFGRYSRMLHSKLPESIQKQLSKHRIAFSVAGVMLLYIGYYSVVHYDTCPITGRKRWITFTKEQILVLADMDRKALIEEYGSKILQPKDPLYQKCNSIVKSLTTHNADIDIVKDMEWKLTVIDDPEIQNAFVLPNGEIFLFTGMINVMSDWEELAIVIGHEMSHAILGHVQEQQSFAVFGELLIIPLLAFTWFLFDDFSAFIVYSIQHFIYPILFEVGFTLPYSRQLETEADEVGLMLASKACFDPRWSVLLWDKMALIEATDALEGNSEINLEFASTHPSHKRRAATLEDRLPEAMSTRFECNCPSLDKCYNPIIKAHELRKFTVNIGEQLKVKEEIQQISKSLKDEQAKSASHKKLEQQLLQLQQKLAILEEEYEELLSKQEKQKISSTAKDSRKSIFDSLWYGLVGVFLGRSSETFHGSLLSETTVQTTNMEISRKDTRKYRDRYSFADEE